VLILFHRCQKPLLGGNTPHPASSILTARYCGFSHSDIPPRDAPATIIFALETENSQHPTVGSRGRVTMMRLQDMQPITKTANSIKKLPIACYLYSFSQEVTEGTEEESKGELGPLRLLRFILFKFFPVSTTQILVG
jgi:hypothetical protein